MADWDFSHKSRTSGQSVGPSSAALSVTYFVAPGTGPGARRGGTTIFLLRYLFFIIFLEIPFEFWKKTNDLIILLGDHQNDNSLLINSTA